MTTQITIKYPIIRQAGFTIIELIMVIVIVGLLAVVAIPRFESFYAIKLSGATKKLVADIRYAQHLAIALHTDSRIDFNGPNDKYDVYKYDQSTSNWIRASDPFTQADLSVDFTSDVQYKGIDIQNPLFGAASSTLQFDWQGQPSNAGQLDLVYRGRSHTISVTARTGRVGVQ